MFRSNQGLSPPFAARELEGEILLDELRELREAAVIQRELNACALAARDWVHLTVPQAFARMKQLAQDRFAGQPELASLLLGWAGKVKTERDLAALAGHLERLALTSALLGAIWRAGARGGGR